MIALFLILAAATASPQSAPAARQQETAPLELVWTGPVSLAIEDDGAEVVVRYDRPLPGDTVAAFRAGAGEDLGRLVWNDDSLVMAAAPGRRLSVTRAADRLLVRFRPETPAGEATGDPVDYTLAQAGADTAAGYPGRARGRLQRLEAQHPRDPHVQRALADLDAATGQRRRAARRYRALEATDPAAMTVRRDANGEAGVSVASRSGSGFSQLEGIAKASVPVSDAASVTGAIRHVRTRSDVVVTPAGVAADVRSDRTLGEANVILAPSPVLRFDMAAVFDFTDPHVSFGGKLYFGSAERELRVLAAYQVPDVSSAEAALLGGRLDRLGGGATLRLAPAVSVQVDAAFNAYHLAREGRQATSITVAGGLDYIVRRREPTLSLLYRLDAEYVDRIDLRADGLPALPLVDRENHTMQALVGQSLGNVRLAAAGGWTFDRFGGNGPTGAATAAASIRSGWRAEMSAGVSSISRPNLPGSQLFMRGSLARSLGE